jgi:hypothetical protein
VPNDVLEESRQTDNPVVAAMAQDKLVKASREAFELQPFDKVTRQGDLDDDALKLVDDFRGWLKKKETTSASTPTSAPSSATPDFSPATVPGLTPVASSPKSDGGCGCP